MANKDKGKTEPVETNEEYTGETTTGEGAGSGETAPTATAAANGKAKVSRSVAVEIKEQYTEKPEDWQDETLADRLLRARELLVKHEIITPMEDKKVKSRLRHTLYGGLAL